jgi:sigma-B regulation protein RsbU (phosphoserine phosphatase)
LGEIIWQEMFQHLARTGMLIGVPENTYWNLDTIQIELGDVLILYTDGITDAFNSEAMPYGEERLRAVVETTRFGSTFEIQNALMNDLNTFSDLAPQQDDITILVIRRVHSMEDTG